MNARRRHAQRGMTLIELMVVLLLLGAAFTYGFLNLGGLIPSARLEEGARDVGSLLARLRGMAIFQGEPFFLEYDLDGQQYRIYRPTTLAEQEDGAPEYLEGSWHVLPTHVRFQDIQFSDRRREEVGRHQVEFLPTGEVTGHLVHFVSDDIADEERNRYTVELNPITGIVTYTKGEKRYQQIQDEHAFR